VERHIDDKKKVVDLTIRPELGPQFLFGTLAIEGLDLHGEAAVKKAWGIKEGKPFDGDYPDYFLQQILRAGIIRRSGPHPVRKQSGRANSRGRRYFVFSSFQRI